MNDNNKMDRGKEHAGPKKMTPRQKQKRNRKATLAAVLCFVAAIAIVGTYTMRDYKTVKKATAGNTDGSGNNGNQDGNSQTNGSQQAARTAGSASSANFTSDSKMIWPVSGTVLMNYSMDKTVYFATLDQYKYNPALVISGAEGDQVLCGAPGIIKSIDVTAQTGTTVTVDLGNGYEVLYGQLKEVPVKVGDQVEAKSILGYIGQPTKYYSVEGCNVYMELRKDGTPVNPVDYMTKR